MGKHDGKAYTEAELAAMMDGERSAAAVTLTMTRRLAGSQPAGEKGVMAFVEHHLGLEPGSPEFEAACARIQKEEIGDREATPEGGEVQEVESYAVNVIRRSEHGPFVLEHQIKAMIKQAASRLGLFAAKGKVGCKGDVAEMGTVEAAGASLLNPKRPWEVYLVDANGKPVTTEWARISGSVGTPQGKRSIQHDTEVAPEGTMLHFIVRWPARKMKAEDMVKTIAAARVIGLGSCLSLDYGRFAAEVRILD